ncbi:MAG: hypothetical protein EHM13_12115 [Acidobacteria bacterium]|nr:MAG: hypothetical protein EHM13_12115 [Acidobacteriota bacterium]
MIRGYRVPAALALAAGLLASASIVAAGQTPPATQTKWTPPVKGIADILVLPTESKVDWKTNTVVTTVKIKNVSLGPIAGLQCEEFWYDKSGNMVPGGDRFRNKKLMQPQEELTITLTSVRDAKMARNNYVFRHANGDVKARQVKKF